MLHRRPLDPAFPHEQQLQAKASPVVLVNLLRVAEADILSLAAIWEKDVT